MIPDVDRSKFTSMRPRGSRGRVRARTYPEFVVAFWARVQIGEASECWPWMGPRHYKGYGEIAACSVMAERKAHRVAYTITRGAIPPGLVLMHSCDNPACCNPAHLTPGTTLENTQDSVKKGRRAPSPTRKLSVDDVRAIRAIGDRQPRKEIAAQFGISGRQVLSILRRESWDHVP